MDHAWLVAEGPLGEFLGDADTRRIQVDAADRAEAASSRGRRGRIGLAGAGRAADHDVVAARDVRRPRARDRP